jgi:PKD repeat protein
LTFEWYFGDDATSKEINPTHAYESPGQYKVTLIVRDALGQAQQKSETVVVGTPPTVSILFPEEGQRFAVGDILRLKGEAFHNNGTAFNNTQLLWEVRKHVSRHARCAKCCRNACLVLSYQHTQRFFILLYFIYPQHADHWHPFLEVFEGNDFDLFPAPEPEDFFASTNSYLEIILHAIDSNGLTGEDIRVVEPKMVSVGVDSSPSGRTILFDSEPITAFQQVWSWENNEVTIQVEDQPPFRFQRWSDGETRRERIVLLNVTSPLFVAFFCVDDGGSCNGDDLVCCEGPCNDVGFCGDVGDIIVTPVPQITTAPTEQIEVTAPTVAPTNLAASAPVALPGSPITSDSDNSMSAGGKAGISIAVLAVLGASMVFFVFPLRKKISSKGSNGSIRSIETCEAQSRVAANSPDRSLVQVDVSKDSHDGGVEEPLPTSYSLSEQPYV